MKILLIRLCPAPETIGLQHLMLVEPLELEVLAGLARPTDQVVIVDLALESDPLEFFVRQEMPDLLGVTGYITNVPDMIAACRTAKRLRSQVVTVVGGVHVEVCPQDLDDPAVDFRVVRNAVTGFPRLLTHLEGEDALPDGVLRSGETVEETALPSFDFRYATPRRDLVDRYRNRYFYVFHDRVALIKTAFGCPSECRFCFCRAITGGHYYERPLGDVIDELADLPQREIYIVDDNFFARQARVEEFIGEHRARSLNKRYLLYGRADFIAAQPGLLADFRDVGLRTVIVGFESFLDSELTAYHKRTSAADNEEAMRVLNRLGIDCYATLIVPPDWGVAEFEFCRATLRRLNVRYVNLQPLTPLPGTEMGSQPGELLLDRRDYARWDLAHVALRPTRLSVPEFYREIIKTYDAVLFRPGVLAGHARRYFGPMLWRMMTGSWRVRRQYEQKMKKERESDHA